MERELIIILILAFITIWECVYLFLCKDKTKSEVKEDYYWMLLKMQALLISIFIFIPCSMMGIALSLSNINAAEIITTIIILILLALLFISNKYIGLAIAKKDED